MNPNLELTFPNFISKKFLKKITILIQDYSSGSQEINEKILRLLLSTRSQKTMNYLIDLFLQTFQSFEVVQNTLLKLKNQLKKKSQKEVKTIIRSIIKSYQKRIEKIYRGFEKYLNSERKILTISNSKTIFDVIQLANRKNRVVKMFVLESNPGKEGTLLHRKFKKIKIHSQLVKDTELEQILSKVDFVLIGADKIYPNKWFINKIGSKKLVEIAKKNSKPIILVSLKEKVITNKKKNKPKLISLRFDRDLFEKVKLDLIDELFIA